MISIITELFLADYINYGEKTDKSVYTISKQEAGVTPEINKDNILIRKEGIVTNQEKGDI